MEVALTQLYPFTIVPLPLSFPEFTHHSEVLRFICENYNTFIKPLVGIVPECQWRDTGIANVYRIYNQGMLVARVEFTKETENEN